jgi:hypothetical protein
VKKLFAACLFALPILAYSNTLQFNATGDNFKFSGYNSTDANGPVAQTGYRNVGQFGSFSIVGNGGGLFSATYLGDESGYNNKYFQNLSLGNQVMGENVLGSTISANIAGPGLIDFGFYTDGLWNSTFKNGDVSNGVLGFAVLKEFVNNYQSVSSAGYNNTTSLGTFDFILGFNDKYIGDADYDDYQVGIKYTPNAVPLPSALPLLATAIGLFGFGANRRRV